MKKKSLAGVVRHRLVSQLDDYKAAERAMLWKALALAEEVHEKQVRRPGKSVTAQPYIVHPMRVALVLLEELEYRDCEVITAALLHDVLESSEGRVKTADLEQQFTGNIALKTMEGTAKLVASMIKSAFKASFLSWVGLVFMIFFTCVVLGLFMMNEGTQKVLVSAFPILAVVLCFVFLAIILFSFLGKIVTQKQAEQIVQAEFLTVEGTAKLGETHSARWGSGYFLEIGETRFAIDARNKFEEGKRYRVYYGRIPHGSLIFSYEKIS